MSGRRITELTVATGVASTDLLPVVDMAGTPTTKRATARQLIDGTPALREPNVRTADYTLTLSDAILAVEMDLAVANTVTVPTDAAVPYPVGTTIPITQIGAGPTTVVAAVGVTVLTPDTLVLPGQNATVMLRKRAADEWVLSQVTVPPTAPVGSVTVFWFDAGGDATAARPAEATATDVVIWANVPSVPDNLGARDQWEDAS